MGIVRDGIAPPTGRVSSRPVAAGSEMEVDAEEGGLGTEQEERHRDGRFSGKCVVMLVWGNIDSFCTILWNRDFSMVFSQKRCFFGAIEPIFPSPFMYETIKIHL